MTHNLLVIVDDVIKMMSSKSGNEQQELEVWVCTWPFIVIINKTE